MPPAVRGRTPISHDAAYNAGLGLLSGAQASAQRKCKLLAKRPADAAGSVFGSIPAADSVQQD